MKIRITMKDPDGVYDSIERAIGESVDTIAGITRDERQTLIEARRDDLDLSRWVEHGEYITVEIDTDAKSARVVPVDEDA